MQISFLVRKGSRPRWNDDFSEWQKFGGRESGQEKSFSQIELFLKGGNFPRLLAFSSCQING